MTQIVCSRPSDSGDEARKKLGAGRGGRGGRKKDVRVRAFSTQQTRLSRSLEQAMNEKCPYSVVYWLSPE